jgi:[acyl-carrier-protein] S-malonyltransferase
MKKVALLFPGQGSQYVGMGKSLCESFKEAKETFEEANNAVGFDIAKLCFDGNIEELTKTENTQPAILTASVAAYRVYMREIGIEPAFTAGHSLGEFSALCCAGGIKFADAVQIVKQRGKFMQEAVPAGIGGMAAISGVSKSVIEDTCAKVTADGKLVAVSNYNSPEQIVISGYIEAVNEAGEKLKAAGARVIPLKVSAPFHSSLMQPSAGRLLEVLGKYSYEELKYPVIANVTAQPYPGKESIIDYLTKQIVQPVRWQESMDYIQKQGVDLAVELGPQTVLRNLMKKNAPSVTTYTFDNEPDVRVLKRQINSNEQKMNKGLEVITHCIAAAVCTKNRNWDDNEYQKGVVQPYTMIKKMKEEISKEGRQPTIEEVRQALDMVKSVFSTKKTPVEEQTERFNDILSESDMGQQFSEYLK